MNIVTALVIFLIFSIAGFNHLEVATDFGLDIVSTTQEYKNENNVESAIDLALWRINVGDDSLANFSMDSITSIYDSSTNQLTVTIDQYGKSYEVVTTLFEDYHFLHGMASDQPINMIGYTISVEDSHTVRGGFRFLPQIDLQYFTNNAVAIHADSSKTWKENDLTLEGIHIFTGDNLNFQQLQLDNSTFVFTGVNIDFNQTCVLKAPSSSNSALPAIILTNPGQIFVIKREGTQDTIHGAIVSYGEIELREGTLTGPIIAHTITLNQNFDFVDDQYSDYYQWNSGFGEFSSYDWPKEIIKWEVN